jgi:hypothetical protein
MLCSRSEQSTSPPCACRHVKCFKDPLSIRDELFLSIKDHLADINEDAKFPTLSALLLGEKMMAPFNVKVFDLVVYTLQRTCSRSKERPCPSCKEHLRRDLDMLLYTSSCPNATLCFMLYYVVYLNSKNLLPIHLVSPCQRRVIVVCTIIAMKYLEESSVRIQDCSNYVNIPVEVLTPIEKLILQELKYELDPGKEIIRAFMNKMDQFRQRCEKRMGDASSEHLMDHSADSSTDASVDNSMDASIDASTLQDHEHEQRKLQRERDLVRELDRQKREREQWQQWQQWQQFQRNRHERERILQPLQPYYTRPSTESSLYSSHVPPSFPVSFLYNSV